jgi:hypothetical protein
MSKTWQYLLCMVHLQEKASAPMSLDDHEEALYEQDEEDLYDQDEEDRNEVCCCVSISVFVSIMCRTKCLMRWLHVPF